MKYAISIFVIVVCLITQSCFNPFAPVSGELEGELILREQLTPDDVLSNFQISYLEKDTLIYANLLDRDFTFRYRDPELGGTWFSWGRDDELITTTGLFSAFNTFDLVWLSTDTLFYINDDSLEVEMVKSLILTIDQEFTFRGDAIFTFRREDKEDIWRIVFWQDETEELN